MKNIDINKDEILKSSKWFRFLFMIVYAFAINFAIPICIGLAFIQFLFVLFTSKVNQPITQLNAVIVEFFNDSLSFLLFQTEEKPFPFKNSSQNQDGEIIEAEETAENIDESEESNS